MMDFLQNMDSRERFNTITHLSGAALAVAGAAVLVVMASLKGDPWKMVAFSIYGAALVMLYLSSTLYHGLSGKPKKVFRKLDHASIYLLIAGTYTPFMLITLRGAWGWSLFGVVWSLAVFGIVLDIIKKDGRRLIPVIIYMLMGWLVVLAIKPLLKVLPHSGFMLLLAGGLLYTGGITFYAMEKRLTYGHGIWHLFVLGGSLSHYLAIILFVL